MTLYGYGIGQSGDVVVNFTANPKPTTVYWRLDDETRINVEPFNMSPVGQRYTVEPLHDVEVRRETAVFCILSACPLLLAIERLWQQSARAIASDSGGN